MRRPRVYLHPVACPKAAVDMEKAAWGLARAGFDVVPEPAAEIGIVFGCGFIDDAKRESIEDILTLVGLKQGSRLGRLVVVGCLPQKYGDALVSSLPEVDAFVGIASLSTLPAVCKRLAGGEPVERVSLGEAAADEGGDDTVCRVRLGGPPWTRTLVISDGCDNACSFCAIPEMRGRLRSRDAKLLAEEMANLVSEGAREVVLAAQDTASYGMDRGDLDLAGLMGTLAGQFPDTWLRLAYANPDNLDEGVAGVIAAHRNICNYIDIPIQHASPRILEAMGRKGPGFKRKAIEELRRAIPDIALRTSVIVGFPGETEEDMADLGAFLEEVRFDMVGVFGFSPQPGTRAAELGGRVPARVREERIVDVVDLQAGISRARMEAMVGRDVEVIIEECGVSGDCLARSQYDMADVDRVIRVEDCEAQPGSMIMVRLGSVSAPFEWTAQGV
jgi:ribosomal protein S12 methylthiotransferase